MRLFLFVILKDCVQLKQHFKPKYLILSIHLIWLYNMPTEFDRLPHSPGRPHSCTPAVLVKCLSSHQSKNRPIAHLVRWSLSSDLACLKPQYRVNNISGRFVVEIIELNSASSTLAQPEVGIPTIQTWNFSERKASFCLLTTRKL